MNMYGDKMKYTITLDTDVGILGWEAEANASGGGSGERCMWKPPGSSPKHPKASGSLPIGIQALPKASMGPGLKKCSFIVFGQLFCS